MVVSMLLAVPALAFAAPLDDEPIQPRKIQPLNESGKTVAPASTRRRHSRHLAHAANHPHANLERTAFFDDAPKDGNAANAVGNWPKTGIASWYGGSRWHGQRTASGAIYDENALTAAHATLPIGTRVRVALAGSDRSVVVTITDRPGTRRRIIDLSLGAARELGMISRGVALVTLTPL
jgi:rare lipoprotein A (peptidoglycan hydrolase)